MSTYPEISHDIPVEKAREMIGIFRKEMENILKDEYKGKYILPYTETFSKEAIRRLIEQEPCEYLRIYYSMDADKRVHLIMVGADADNRDITPGSLTGKITPTYSQGVVYSAGVVLEEGTRCPPDCPTGTPPPPID